MTSRPAYRPMHAERSPGRGKENGRNEAGFGASDGMQSESETSEIARLLETTDGDGNSRIRGQAKGRYTKWHNEG